MSRLSIYAGQQDAVQEFTRATADVLAGAWQAVDGSVAVALVNLTEYEIPLHLTLARDDYPLAQQGVVRRILEQESTPVGTFRQGTAVLELTLDPTDVRIYEFVAQ